MTVKEKKEKVEKFEKLINIGVNTLRELDIERGLITENFEPFNGWLPAKENKRCWEYLAKRFVRDTLFSYLIADVPISVDKLFVLWLSFLEDVNDVVRYGNLNGTIEDIINNSGISEETWVKFLD